MARNLVHGSRGEDVAQVQAALNVRRAERPLLDMDGVFGPKTHQRVVAFQRAYGLVPDGIVGPKTRAKLFGPGVVLLPAGGPPIVVAWPPSQTQLIRVLSDALFKELDTNKDGKLSQVELATAGSATVHQITRLLQGVTGNP